jgi:hypothetical protein
MIIILIFIPVIYYFDYFYILIHFKAYEKNYSPINRNYGIYNMY